MPTNACQSPDRNLDRTAKGILTTCLHCITPDRWIPHGKALACVLLFVLAGAWATARADEAPPGRYAQVGGHRLYYETYGEGPPVVLLHGGGADIHSTFDAQIEFLAEHHHVIAMDQRGHGRSPDVPGPLTYAAMAEDTAGLLQQLHVSRADFIGFSDGANIALILAIRHPRLVRRIVASGANLDPDGLTKESLEETRNSTGLDEFDPEAREAYAEESPDGAAHLPVFAAKLRTLWLTRPTADVLSPSLLQKIRARVLVMAGDQDEVRLEHTALIFHSIPDARLWILPHTGHSTFALRPQWVNPMLQSFLDAP